MKIIKCALLIALLSICICKDTYDEDFKKMFSARHFAKGDGKNFPDPGDEVSVHYTGYFPNTNPRKVFDSSVQRDKPLVFNVKRGVVIPCWDEVVSRMSLNEKISIICPAKLAYGEKGMGNMIPPNSDLAFEIELLSFKSKLDYFNF
jgi:FK506-binding protein 1